MEHATRDPTNSDSRQPKVLVPVEGYTNVNAFTVAYDPDKNTSKALRDEWKRIEGKREEILKKTLYVFLPAPSVQMSYRILLVKGTLLWGSIK